MIGTLTRLAVEAGMEVYIISGDKDFAQLISDRVRMVDTLRDITFDPELVRKKWGVPPSKFVDLLAMIGDKVDNIPGIPGVGQKTATKLLDTYGDLDGILAHVDEFKGKQKQRFEDHRDQAILSRELATIDLHVPLELGLDDLKLVSVEPSALNELYKRLEFYSLLSEAEVAKDQAASSNAEFASIGSLAELDQLLASLPGPDEGAVAVFPVVDPPSSVRGDARWARAVDRPRPRAASIPLACVGGLGDAAIAKLRPWLEDPQRYKLGHDCKALWVALARVGVRLRGVVGDLMLESFLVDPAKLIPHELGQIAKEYLQRTIPPAKRVLGAGQKAKLFSELDADELCEWSGQQVEAIAAAFPLVRARLDEEGHREYLETVELPLVVGARADGARRHRGRQRRPRRRWAGSSASGWPSARPRSTSSPAASSTSRSPKQLGEVLFDELKLPVIKRTKTGYSTNAEVLERLAAKTDCRHEIAEHLLEHRKLAKLINTYTEVLQNAVNPATGRIHATFQQTVGVSGRLITTDPDLQRTPVKTPEGRRIRQAFVARRGCKLICADWSQIELRLLAHFTGDPMLVEGFVRGPRRPRAHGRPAVRRRGRPGHERAASGRQDGQLRDHLRPGRDGARADPRDPAQGGRDLHQRVLRVLRRGPQPGSTRPSPRPTSTATSRPCSAAAATSPSCRATTGRTGSTASGSRPTRRSRARPRTSASSRCWPSTAT